jgi:hypothetical protein
VSIKREKRILGLRKAAKAAKRSVRAATRDATFKRLNQAVREATTDPESTSNGANQ